MSQPPYGTNATLQRKPHLLVRTQSLPALQDGSADSSLCSLPGGFNDILGRSQRLSAALRDPRDEFGPRLILSKLAGKTPPSPPAPKRQSYTLGDWMHGFKIGDRVSLIGRAGLTDSEEGGTVLAVGKTLGFLIVKFDSMVWHSREVKADSLHHMTTKEDEELEIKMVHRAHREQEREARRLDRIRRSRTTE